MNALHVPSPQSLGSIGSFDVDSYGGGYFPVQQEYWFPSWTGGNTVVRRFSEDATLLGDFTLPQRHVMDIWGDVDRYFYTAHWDDNTISKWGPYPSQAHLGEWGVETVGNKGA